MSKVRRGHIERGFPFKINVFSQKPESLIHYPSPHPTRLSIEKNKRRLFDSRIPRPAMTEGGGEWSAYKEMNR